MSEIKKRSFEFNEQETYSRGEVENILTQHNTFLTGSYKKELEDQQGKIATLTAANKEYSTKEKSRLVKKLAKTISEDNYEKLVKYTSIKEGATEEEIKIALEETNKDFSVPKPADTATPKVETITPKSVPTPAPVASDKFSGL